MIGFSNNKTSLLAKLIRFFTNSKMSHTFVITFPSAGGDVMFEEASHVVTDGVFKTNYIDDTNTQYWIYKIKDGIVSEDVIDKSLVAIQEQFLGVTYGKLQLLFFPYRWIMNTIFHKDVNHEKNWFTNGVICSELVYHYLYNLGQPFQDMLSDFNSDTIQAQDILNIINSHPDVFEFVEEKL